MTSTRQSTRQSSTGLPEYLQRANDAYHDAQAAVDGAARITRALREAVQAVGFFDARHSGLVHALTIARFEEDCLRREATRRGLLVNDLMLADIRSRVASLHPVTRS